MQAHHVCIYDEYVVFDGEVIPFGKKAIEKEITRAINEILDMIVHKIGKGEVVVCGTGDARRMLGRKLEDRLGRVVVYE
jgi:uncharacterized hydantoinase/oxoprolinase family protein